MKNLFTLFILIATWVSYSQTGTERYNQYPPPPENEDIFKNNNVQKEFFKDDLISTAALQAPNFGGYITSDNEGFVEGIITAVEKDDPSGGSRTDYFDLPPSDFNLVLTLQITASNDDKENQIGSKRKFHLLNYAQGSKDTVETLESLLVLGRKIKIKTIYFGYGAEDIYYIKHVPRSL